MLRIYASEDGFDELNLLQTRLHELTNWFMYTNLRDIPEVERQEELEWVRNRLEELQS
jgi:hypothetical protein